MMGGQLLNNLDVDSLIGTHAISSDSGTPMILPAWIDALASANNFVSPSQSRIERRSSQFETESEKDELKIVTVL
jgi:hypothetical protein